MSVEPNAIKGVVLDAVTESMGGDMAQYVADSMDNDPASPFAKMVMDAVEARQALDAGDRPKAQLIVRSYRDMAQRAGFELMFDAMMESLGLGDILDPNQGYRGPLADLGDMVE